MFSLHTSKARTAFLPQKIRRERPKMKMASMASLDFVNAILKSSSILNLLLKHPSDGDCLVCCPSCQPKVLSVDRCLRRGLSLRFRDHVKSERRSVLVHPGLVSLGIFSYAPPFHAPFLLPYISDICTCLHSPFSDGFLGLSCFAGLGQSALHVVGTQVRHRPHATHPALLSAHREQ